MIGYVSVEEQVEKDFDRALLKASLHRLKNHLRRRGGAHGRLPSFEEAKGALTHWSQSYRGMMIVDVERIKGSVGRYEDFDGSFLPLKVDMAERWGRIDRAYHRGDELPAVSLYKVGEAYFVRDGNHRVSVAKYHKVAAIDAEVVELRGQIRTDAAQPAAPSTEEAGAENGEAAHSEGPVGTHERRVSHKQVKRQSEEVPRLSRGKKGAQQIAITTRPKEAWWAPEGIGQVTAALGLLAAVLVVATLMLLGASSPANASTTFTVNSTAEYPDALLDDTVNVCDVDIFLRGEQCTLRAAIEEANHTEGADAIHFNIPATGVQTIKPSSALPVITEVVLIDGYTQPGSSPNTLTRGTTPLGYEGGADRGQRR